jgi:hypothetical protein
MAGCYAKGFISHCSRALMILGFVDSSDRGIFFYLCLDISHGRKIKFNFLKRLWNWVRRAANGCRQVEWFV